ncbi:CMRF-35-like molecule 4 isoform X2 [Siphateles boraxobius]|uniref:CMRF-35-like molecule 4 isoform X2 n=1 Tax=Siphateles boraxobius TaxID=180520 RepID=UPI00406280CF
MIYISVGFWLILGVECFGGSNHIVTIKTGGSVTIPCHYDEKNPPQKKYWFSVTDNYSISINTTEENLSVIDHPDQSLFTVTMRNLQNKHNGEYYCSVETEGNLNFTYELYLSVQPAPDVSVMNSSVSGHEVGRTETSQNSSVQISDDGRSSFTVLMTGLRLSDSGWYYCCAGEALNPVQLTVTEAEPVNGATDNPKDSNKGLTVWLPVSAALLLLLILVGVFTWRLKRRPKQDKHQNRERNDSRTVDAIYSKPEEETVIYNTINDECPTDPKDVTYSIIDDTPKPPVGGTIYSTVAPH